MGRIEDRIRVLLNDQRTDIWSDEKLAPFISEAKNRIPFLAASLIAHSVGLHEAAESMLRWPVPKQEVKVGVEAPTHEVAGKTDSRD